MSQRLSGRQLAVMRVLWEKGRATVAEVQESLAVKHPLAYSTVATLLARMEKKGVVRHEVLGRTFIYEPLVSEEGVGRSLVRDLLRRAFDDSPSQLVSYLLDTGDVDSREFDRIKQLLRQHESRRDNHSRRGGAGQAADEQE